jgi:hypothetical protein
VGIVIQIVTTNKKKGQKPKPLPFPSVLINPREYIPFPFRAW